MKSINEYLITEPHLQPDKGERTDEVVGVLLASSLLAFACGGLFNSEVGKGIGGFFAGLGSLFGGFSKNNDSDKKAEKDQKEDDKKDKAAEKEKEKQQEKDKEEKEEFDKEFAKNKKSNQISKEDKDSYNKLLTLAKKSNDKEKDATLKKKNESMLNLLTACSFDKDGNEIPFDQRLEKMKDALPAGTDFEEFKKDMQAEYDKVKDDPEFKKQLEKAGKDIKDSDVDTFVNNAKAEARKTWHEIDESNKKQKEIDDEIAKLKSRLEDDPDNDDLKKKIEQKRDEKKNADSPFGAIGESYVNKTKKRLHEEDAKLQSEYEKYWEEWGRLYDEADELEKELENASEDKKEELQKKLDAKRKEVDTAWENSEKTWNARMKNWENEDVLDAAYDKGDPKTLEAVMDSVDKDIKNREEELKQIEKEETKEEPKSAEKKETKEEPKSAEKEETKEEPKSAEKEETKKEPKSAEKEETKEEPKSAEKEETKEEPKSAEKEETKKEPKSAEKEETKKEPKSAEKEETKKEPKSAEKEEKVEKDKDGNILKKEKVVDKETGKKVEVVTHTGPRGGKFYYPDGKPKTDKNKVYVTESQQILQGKYMSLKDYMKILTEGFNK